MPDAQPGGALERPQGFAGHHDCGNSRRSCGALRAPAQRCATRVLRAMKTLQSAFWASMLAAIPSGARSGDLPPVDPNIRHVASAGYWKHAGRSGVYRVVVYAGGFEHVVTSVVAEWVAEPTRRDDPVHILVRRDLLRDSMVSLGPPVLQAYPHRVRVTLGGVFTAFPDSRISCVYDLLEDGTVQVVRKCS